MYFYVSRIPKQLVLHIDMFVSIFSRYIILCPSDPLSHWRFWEQCYVTFEKAYLFEWDQPYII